MNDPLLVDYLELICQFNRLERTKRISKRDASLIYLDKRRIMESIEELQMKSNGPVIRGHCNQ